MLYSRQEMAEMLGISKQALSQRIKARDIEPCDFDKVKLRFLYNEEQFEMIKNDLKTGPKPKK